MKLSSLFSDHAVLQRDRMVPVWGRTHPLQPVRVALGPHRAAYRSGSDGRFVVRLPPMPAGGPYDLTVETDDPAERAMARDVFVGDVWLCSGQSNMQWTCAEIRADPDDAVAPRVRMLTVSRVALAPRDDADAQWERCEPRTFPGWSAVAAYFGLRLHRELDVPIGLLNSSWGGTRIEAWLSRPALTGLADTALEVARYEATCHDPAFWTPSVPEATPELCPPDDGTKGEAAGWADPAFHDQDWPAMELPATWQARGVAGNGALWFRRTVDLPAAWEGRDLQLGLGAVDKHDVTYFNGTRVGATGQDREMNWWNVPRTYRIPARLVRPGPATIAVRAYSFVYNGGLIGPARHMRLGPADEPEAARPLAGCWRYRVEFDLGVVAPSVPPPGPGNPNSPYMLFDSMIRPLVPYAIRGAIWYQGESNAERPGQYRERLVALIRDWRRAWGQGDFPFGIVQLAGFRAPSLHQPDSPWARLREAQAQALAEPATGLAVTMDLGDELNIHPPRKREVGERLAQWALADVHARPIPATGPRFAGMTVERERLRLRFHSVGGGLVAPGGPPRGFFIAGPARDFHPAEARIEDDTVIVSHPAVPEPEAVRYAWADHPEGCNLYNTEGLPAMPFRCGDAD